RVPEEHHGILETVVCSDSWEALAVEIQVDPTGLVRTLENLKGNRMDPNGKPCAYPPGLTAVKGYGGLLVDDQQRVLDAGGTPVPGLYAAGEASGMAVPGMGGLYGFDGSLSAVVWSGWRAAESINAAN
ncbi:MAG: putative oxidoreductase, partial [Cognaticolwellia sp.]